MHWNLSCWLTYALTAFIPLQIDGATTQTEWPLHLWIPLLLRLSCCLSPPSLLHLSPLTANWRSIAVCKSELRDHFSQRLKDSEGLTGGGVQVQLSQANTDVADAHGNISFMILLIKGNRTTECVSAFLCACIMWLLLTHLFTLITPGRFAHRNIVCPNVCQCWKESDEWKELQTSETNEKHLTCCQISNTVGPHQSSFLKNFNHM